jgi:murein L,D-transpeptidase YafK
MSAPRLAVVVVALGIAGVLTGCSDGWFTAKVPANTAAWQPPISDEDRIDWAKEEPLFVVIRKSCRRLDVYQYGERVRSFSVVFGLGGDDRKLYEGDMRTPRGLYSIIETRPHARWGHFFLLDYPNNGDRHRYFAALDSGDIPKGENGFTPGMGGAVGIHGTDKPDLNKRGIDWTWGCISLSNSDMDALAGLVSVGTPVWIED